MPAAPFERDGSTRAGFRLEELPSGWLIGRFSLLAATPGIAHAVTTRRGPGFDPGAGAAAHRRSAAAMGAALGARAVAFCRQVHGPDVLQVARGGPAGPADALVTATPGLGVLGRSADCPLVLAVARDGRGRALAVGMAHASWRSTVARITERMIARLLAAAGGDARPARVVAAIAPSAGPCCYEVGPDVRDAALAGLGPGGAGFFAWRDGRLIFDLWRANVAQLRRAGVPAPAVQTAGVCTICRADLFPSWRREGEAAGRFAAMIALAGP